MGWFTAGEVAAEDLAFLSMQAVWRRLLASQTAQDPPSDGARESPLLLVIGPAGSRNHR